MSNLHLDFQLAANVCKPANDIAIQCPKGCDIENGDTPDVVCRALFEKHIENRQHRRQCLSRARRGNYEYISSLKNRRDCDLLYVTRFFQPNSLQVLSNGSVQLGEYVC